MSIPVTPRFVFQSLLFLMICCSHIHGHGKEKSKVLLISFDGFRHDYFDLAEKSGMNLKNFKKVFKIGFKASYLSNVFITRTFPNHMSIITGCYEETHGIVDNIFFDPIFNETFSYKNVTQSLQSKWFSNSEPLWATNIINGGKSAVIYWPGQLAPYKNNIYPTHSFGIYNKDLPLDLKFEFILNWLSNHDTTLGILYHPEPDGTGHQFGPSSKMILQRLLELDKSIGYLLDRIESLSLSPHLNVIIVSDHGMTDISNDRRVIIDKYIDPSRYYHFTESYTLWSIWPKHGTNVSDLLQRLRPVSHMKAYRKDEIPTEWHYANNRRVAPIVIVADPGWVLVHNETDTVTMRGTHGYATASPDMMGVFVAWGPDIAASNRSDVNVRVVDVFPLVAEILRFERVPSNNGSLANVRWMLRVNMDEAGIFTSLVISEWCWWWRCWCRSGFGGGVSGYAVEGSFFRDGVVMSHQIVGIDSITSSPLIQVA